MSESNFVDYYETLELSCNANTETIDRVFRHLAKKFHPDNPNSADSERFRQILEAHGTLSDPEARAGYDAKYQDYWNRKWRVASEIADHAAFDHDQITRQRLLSLLYVQRRRFMLTPGLGQLDIARLLSCPPELIEFHLWYLKAKHWVERLDTGHLAITAAGVDEVEQNRLLLGPDRMIEAQTYTGDNSDQTSPPLRKGIEE